MEQRVRGRWVLAAILFAAFLVRAPELNDPWPAEGFKAGFGGFAVGAHARGFEQHGFLESGLLPFYWRIERADGTAEYDTYSHHPPFYALLSGLSLRVFGPEEWAIRLPWLLISLLAIAALHRFFARVWGSGTAALCSVFLAIAPLSSWWSTLVWCDFAVLALYGMALHRYVLWLRDGRRGDLLVVAGYFLAGGFVDWTMHFILPGLVLHGFLAVRGRKERQGWSGPAALLCLPAAAGLSVLVHSLHMRLVLPPESARADLSDTLAWVLNYPEPMGEFIARQWGYFLNYVPWPLALFVVAGLAWIVFSAARSLVQGSLDRERSLALALLPPGLIYVFCFPARSWNHDFFIYLSLPAFAIAAALAFLAVRRACAALPAPLATVLPVLLGCLLVVSGVNRHGELLDDQRSDRVALLVEQAWMADLLQDPSGVVLTCNGVGNFLPFYSRAAIVHSVNFPSDVEDMRARVLSDLPPGSRPVFLFDLHHTRVLADLYQFLLGVCPPPVRHVELKGEGVGLDVFDLTGFVEIEG